MRKGPSYHIWTMKAQIRLRTNVIKKEHLQNPWRLQNILTDSKGQHISLEKAPFSTK